MTDPHTLPMPAQDPWEGRAAVPADAAPPTTGIVPQVVYVEMRRRRRWPWVLGIMAMLGVICCGACALITAPVWEQYPSRIAVLPDNVGGLHKDDNDVVKVIVVEAVHRIRTEQQVDDAFAGAFADPKNKERGVIVFGATRLVWDPADEMKKTIQTQGRQLSNITGFPAGGAGQLKCANSKDDQDKPIVVCAWIDHGSLGIGVFYGERPMSECASFLRALREEIIIRP